MNLRLPSRRYLRLSAWRIPFEIWVPVLYALVASLWIYLSDTLVTWLARSPEDMRLLSTYKGWSFVAFTAALLLLVLRRIFARIRTLNETLEQRVRERTALAEQRADQLRALALQLTRAEQRERRRVAHILHEHFQQLLVAVKYHVDRLRRPHGVPEAALQPIYDALNEAIRTSRSLTVELSPPILHDAGLVPALSWLVRWMRERYGLQVTAVIDPAAEPAEEDLRDMLFAIVRELLLNVVNHAGVTAARLEMTARPGEVCILVADEGHGFDPAAQPSPSAAAAGYGLFSMRERLEQIGGRLEIDSAPGHGTRIHVTVPARTDGR